MIETESTDSQWRVHGGRVCELALAGEAPDKGVRGRGDQGPVVADDELELSVGVGALVA